MSMDGVEIFVHPSASYHELRKAHVIVDHIRECTLKVGSFILKVGVFAISSFFFVSIFLNSILTSVDSDG